MAALFGPYHTETDSEEKKHVSMSKYASPGSWKGPQGKAPSIEIGRMNKYQHVEGVCTHMCVCFICKEKENVVCLFLISDFPSSQVLDSGSWDKVEEKSGLIILGSSLSYSELWNGFKHW